MANAVVQVPPDAGGKKIDTSQVSIFGDVVQRQRVSLFDPSSADSGVTVENGALNVSVQSGLMFGRAEDQGARPSPRMVDSNVQLPPDSTGKKLDMSAITTVGGDLVQRQRIVLADSNDPTGLVTVTGGALNVNIVRLGGNFVSVLTPNDGDVLTFDAATGRWVSRAPQYIPPPPTPAPTITSVTPNSGSTAGGTVVTITGSNFAAGATVAFGGNAATNVTFVNDLTLTATTPARAAGTVTVVVTVGAQSANLANAFTFIAPAPTVSSISPTSGSTAGGTNVTITGTNFSSGATVTFGGTAATNVVVSGGVSITCTTPARAAGAATVRVTVSGQSADLTNGFTYVVPPTVTGVAPNVGPANTATPVTITGTGFASGATVTFGGTAATNVVVVNATSITCTAPARAAGAVVVQVTSGGLSGSMSNAFTYQTPAAPIYGGFGDQGATATATLSGTQVTLSNGTVLNQLQTTAETVGENWEFTGLADHCVYLLLTGSSRTFRNPITGLAFPFDPPITVNLSGRTLYLYASQFPLYGTVKPEVVT